MLASAIAGFLNSVKLLFAPKVLFTGLQTGVTYDPLDMTSLFQDAAGTIPVTTFGQTIQQAADRSGKGFNATQSSASASPILSGSPRTLGAELVTNGRFAVDSNWVKGAGWTITGGKAVNALGVVSNLSQPQALVAGTSYFVHFTVTATAGSVTPQFSGGVTLMGNARSASGSYVELFLAKTGNNAIDFVANATFNGTVTNVTIKPVTKFVNQGLYFNGAGQMQSPAIDMSASSSATIVFSYFYGQTTANETPFELGNFYSNVAGSATSLINPNPTGRIRGGTSQTDFAATDGGTSGVPIAGVQSMQIDFSQATVGNQLIVRSHGNTMETTISGVASGATNMVNGSVSLGSATNNFLNFAGGINRFFAINRKLTTAELLQAETWAKRGMAYCAVIGDSTSAVNNAGGGLTNTFSTSSLVGGMICGRNDVSTSGEKIADQKARWLALPDKSALQVVLIQIGLNDINTFIGVGKTTAQIIADLQDLVTTVNASKPVGCKTYIAGLTPCRGWIGVASGFAAAAYQAWLDVNTAIAGGGSSPITGVDARISGHVAALGDGNGYLNPIYNFNGDNVHPSNEGKFIVGQYWRSQLETDGLVI